MKSFEHIARAMYQAFLKESEGMDRLRHMGFFDRPEWERLSQDQRAPWVAAAREAAAQLAQVH